MRISILAAAVIAAPVLLLTACGNTPQAKPVKGTVIEKEYEPAKTKKQKVATTTKNCVTKTVKGKRKSVCKTTHGYKTKTVTVKKECYEVDIRLTNGHETEICDRYAYYVLKPGDRYSSAIDYSKRTR